MAKLYTVVKNGEELETLKTLAAAKKLADAEDAEIYVDGEKVYEAMTDAATTTTDASETGQKDEADGTVVLEGRETITAAPVVAKKPTQPVTPSTPTTRYRLKALMNERCRPDIKAAIRQVRAEGTVVRVEKVHNDWLFLADGGYILYEGGKWAEKVE